MLIKTLLISYIFCTLHFFKSQLKRWLLITKLSIQIVYIMDKDPLKSSHQDVRCDQRVHENIKKNVDYPYPRQRPKPPVEKISVGIACVRFASTGIEMLLVRKRYTYAYNMFVNGRYKSDSSNDIITLFNTMTVDEKLDIMSLNFVQIWYRVWLNNLQKTSSFYTAKSKFENTFVADGGARLKRLMAKSKENGQLIWEIPKGRKKGKTETNIVCAVREFAEETTMNTKHYSLCRENLTHSYISDGTKYTNIYYFAFARHGSTPCVNVVNQTQIGEIAEIKWMNMNAISQIDIGGRLKPIAKKIFKFMKTLAKI